MKEISDKLDESRAEANPAMATDRLLDAAGLATSIHQKIARAVRSAIILGEKLEAEREDSTHVEIID